MSALATRYLYMYVIKTGNLLFLLILFYLPETLESQVLTHQDHMNPVLIPALADGQELGTDGL